MNVKEDYPNLCCLLELWGIGDYQSDLTDSAKMREHVRSTPNSYVEELVSEFSKAMRNVDSIYNDLAKATYWNFKSPMQCRAKLAPFLDELIVIRDERYLSKGS